MSDAAQLNLIMQQNAQRLNQSTGHIPGQGSGASGHAPTNGPDQMGGYKNPVADWFATGLLALITPKVKTQTNGILGLGDTQGIISNAPVSGLLSIGSSRQGPSLMERFLQSISNFRPQPPVPAATGTAPPPGYTPGGIGGGNRAAYQAQINMAPISAASLNSMAQSQAMSQLQGMGIGGGSSVGAPAPGPHAAAVMAGRGGGGRGM